MADITSKAYPVVTDSEGGDQYTIVRNGQLKKQTRTALDEHITDIAATDFTGLSDTPGTYIGQQGKGVIVNATEDGLEYLPSTTTPTFITLPDTPAGYSGQAGKHARVNATNNGVEFELPTFLEQADTPASFAGNADKVLKVSSGESSVEFADVVAAEAVIYVTEAAELSGALDSAKVYWLDGIIDFTGTGISIEVPAGGLNLSGWTFDVSKIVCADPNYTLFTSPVGGSGNVLGKDYAIEVTGANSEVYDLVSATGFDAFEFARINYNDCSSLGAIDGYRQGLEVGTGRFGGTPELTLKGAWGGGYFIDTSIVRGLIDGAYSLFKAGAGFTMASRFRSNQNIDLNSTVAFFDFSSANFTTPSTVQLDGCIVSRNGVFDASDTTITPNMQPSDLAAEWVKNNGIQNTFVGGELLITSEIASAVGSVGVFVDLAGTWTSSDLQHFDSPGNGQLRHLGESPVEYTIGGQLVVDSSSNNEVDIKVAIWRDSLGSFVDGKTQRRVVNNLQGGRDVAYFALSDNITLNQNDYVKLQCANATATNDITAELDSFIIVSAR